MDKIGYVYILASGRNGTLYIGVTSDLVKRVWEHKEKLVSGFSRWYAVDRLVYFERCEDLETALNREKQLKRWRRRWKLELIERFNPYWRDLYGDVI